MFRTLLLGLLLTAGLGAQPVFTLTTEATATSSDGTSASSKVTVRLGPGTEWHGHFGTNYGGVDTRTPQKLYALRGGLYGLREAEPMGFGILSHKGSARAGLRTLSGPGSIQQSSSGYMWTLREDAARFTRDKDGGVFTCAPVVYLDEEPPEFGLLSPGAYDFGAAGNDRYRSLLTFRLTNEDLRNLLRMRKVQEGSFTSEDGGVTQRYKLTLEGAPPEDEAEVTVTVDDSFDTWIPRGKLDKPNEPGDLPLKVTVKVHKKGEPGVPREAMLEISLPHVSKNRGVCGNWPLNASPEEGLRFRQKDFPEKEGLLYKDRTHLASDILLEEAMFRVHAHDFGAWGTLRVTATDNEGRPLKVTVRGKDTPDLDIPKDENANRIADEWETRWAGGLRASAAEDEDALPQGDGHSGDVLTLYEEYRGFRISGSEGGYAAASPSEMTTGRHVRTDPRLKDVFICDQLGYGIGFFRQSGLCVHLVTAEECGATQKGAFNPHTINPNRDDQSKDEQYVLWLMPGTGTLQGDDEGGANMKPGWGSPGPPRDCEGVYLNLPALQGETGFDPAKKIKNTLTHELAHGCSVKHHGERKIRVFKAEYLADHIDDQGQKHPKGTIDTGEWDLGPLPAGGQGASFSSGDTHCYMTYKLTFLETTAAPTFALWDAAGKRYTALLYKCGSTDCVQTHFCDAPSTWRIGPAGPPDPNRGQCLRQFCVNHLKH